MSRSIPAIFLLVGCAAWGSAEPPGSQPPGGGRHALLIGCSRYDHLEANFQLDGPVNDIPMLTRTLKVLYGFTDSEVVELSEAAALRGGASRRPTRANIEREFAQLAKSVHPDDQVVIWLSGHGSREPDSNPPKGPPKPDGCREIFLPCDIMDWDEKKGTAVNAVFDYELRDWLRKITDRKAFVWVIVDACHSATLCREGPEERTKEVPPEVLGIPAAVPRPTAAAAPDGMGLASGNDRLVAFYACQPAETTPEWRLPDLKKADPWHALFTWTLCQELQQAHSGRLTYRELLHDLRTRYDQNWEVHPHPLAEFAGQDRLVLGREQGQRRPFLLGRASNQEWQIDGGALHGLTVDSVLEVLPPAGKGDHALGHVKVTAVRPFQSDVTPCPFAGIPAPAKEALAADCRCRPVYVACQELRLRLGVVAATASRRLSAAERESERKRLVAEADRQGERVRLLTGRLREKAGNEKAAFEEVDDPSRADWLLVLSDKEAALERGGGLAADLSGPAADVRLVRGADGSIGWLTEDGRRPRFPLSGGDDGLIGALAAPLARIARAELLYRLAAASATAPAPSGLSPEQTDFLLEVTFSRKAAAPRKGMEEFDPVQEPPRCGERVTCEVASHSQKSLVAVTILYIDSDFRITVLQPTRGELNPLLGPDQSLPAVEVPVGEGRQPGPEHIVVLAVRSTGGRAAFAGGSAPDFAWLAEPDLEKTRDVVAGPRAAGKRTFDSPLGQLFRRGLFRDGDARGLVVSTQAEYLALVRSWEPTPAGK